MPNVVSCAHHVLHRVNSCWQYDISVIDTRRPFRVHTFFEPLNSSGTPQPLLGALVVTLTQSPAGLDGDGGAEAGDATRVQESDVPKGRLSFRLAFHGSNAI